MGNTLKMEKTTLLHGLFQNGWSNRKINIATGIHRNTISNHRAKWQELNSEDTAFPSPPIDSDKPSNQTQNSNQNVPPTGDNECPPAQVAHFPARHPD